MTSPDPALPLEGLRVLDLTSSVVGPYATQILADYGADVIKVEQQSGDIIRWISGRSPTPGMSGKFMHMNRNKRSLSIDLKSRAGRRVLMALAAKADIFIHNMRADAAERLGIRYEDILAVNDRILYCAITGFGSGGPYAGRPAYDSVLQGGTGLASLFAGKQGEGEPRFVPYVVVDRTVGLMTVNAVLAAVVARQARPGPRAIEVPMFESYASLILSEHLYGETFEPPISGGSERGEPGGHFISSSGDSRLLDPNAKPVKTLDGYLCITTNTDAQVMALFDAIGRPELKEDPRFRRAVDRIDHIGEFFAIRAAALAARGTDEWLEILDRHDIPAMPCHTVDTLLRDPHIVAVGLVESVPHPSQGRVKHIRVPVHMSDCQPALRRHAPRVGEQTADILAELGYEPEAIAAMLASGEAYAPEDAAG